MILWLDTFSAMHINRTRLGRPLLMIHGRSAGTREIHEVRVAIRKEDVRQLIADLDAIARADDAAEEREFDRRPPWWTL